MKKEQFWGAGQDATEINTDKMHRKMKNINTESTNLKAPVVGLLLLLFHEGQKTESIKDVKEK